MNVRHVTSLRDFDALAPLWREVTGHSGQTSPFLSHDWFACCWRTAGPERAREVWIVEDAAGPLGLIPLARSRVRVRGLPVRVLEFLESVDTPFADLLAAADPERVIEAFASALPAERNWDLLVLRKLPARSRTTRALQAALAGRFRWTAGACTEAPYVAISGRWEEFLGQRSARFRKTLRNVENRAGRTCAIEVEEHRQVDPDGPLFAEVLEVSSQSWKGPAGLAMATMQGMPRFFRELTRRASANGWLHLWVLRAQGRAVATEYQIRDDGCYHALRADFDPTVAELSPGTYLNLHILRALFERAGTREYDMGPGSNPYKLRWATGVHELLTLRAYAPTPCGRLLHAIENGVVPLARRVRAQVVGR